jgi:hypothetical protein
VDPGTRSPTRLVVWGLWACRRRLPPRTGFRKIVVVRVVTVDEAGQGPHPSPASPDHLGPRLLRRGTTKIDLDRGLRHPTAGTPTALAGKARARRLSCRDRDGERCDQLPQGHQNRRWLAPFRLPLMDTISKNTVGRTGFAPVTSSVSGKSRAVSGVCHRRAESNGEPLTWANILTGSS